MNKIVYTKSNNPVEPKVTEVYNLNDGGYIKFWKGTLTQYNELESVDKDTVYIVELDI